MDGNEAVVHLLVDEVVTRNDELGTNRHGQDATGTQQHGGHNDVLDTDDLVVRAVLPVARTPLVLTGVVQVVSAGVVRTDQPATGSVKGTDAEPEAEDPANGQRRRDEVRVVTARRVEEVVSQEPAQPREHHTTNHGGEEVLTTRQSATLRCGRVRGVFKC